jgi:hypothetical protein
LSRRRQSLSGLPALPHPRLAWNASDSGRSDGLPDHLNHERLARM